jgi:hypothetical protein
MQTARYNSAPSIRGPTADEVRAAARRRWDSWDKAVPQLLPTIEPDLAERVADRYGGCPAYDGDVPVATALVLLALCPDWPDSKLVPVLQACVGCGCLTAYYALRSARDHCTGRRPLP